MPPQRCPLTCPEITKRLVSTLYASPGLVKQISWQVGHAKPRKLPLPLRVNEAAPLRVKPTPRCWMHSSESRRCVPPELHFTEDLAVRGAVCDAPDVGAAGVPLWGWGPDAKL